jgi:hypothetical protein
MAPSLMALSREQLRQYQRASERAMEAIAQLGVLADQPARLKKVCSRVELFLWKFLRLRWYDIHRFFTSVEPKEAMELSREKYQPGMVFHFFSERQDPLEWENCMTVGLSLVFAAMRQAAKRGFNPKTVGIFTLQRMMEQAVEPIEDLEELLQIGAPP